MTMSKRIKILEIQVEKSRKSIAEGRDADERELFAAIEAAGGIEEFIRKVNEEKEREELPS